MKHLLISALAALALVAPVAAAHYAIDQDTDYGRLCLYNGHAVEHGIEDGNAEHAAAGAVTFGEYERGCPPGGAHHVLP